MVGTWRTLLVGIVGLCAGPVLVAVAAPARLETVTTYPYREDFEAGMGLWNNIGGDDFDWDRYCGPTPTDNTGPDVDHTLGTEEGYYVYTEASGENNPDKTAILVGPCFDLTQLTSPEVAFWYHMAGDSMGSLYLEMSTDDGETWEVAFERSGHQGYEWLLAVLDLSAYAGQTIKLRFRGVTADGYESDMAVDDIYAGEAVAYPGGCCDTDTGECLGYMTEAECAAHGNVTWHRVADCSEENFCPQPPPANDACENATVISSLPFTDTEVDYRWATPDPDVSCNDEGCAETEYGVWYTYTPLEDCGARVTVDRGDGGGTFTIAAFSGMDCGDLAEVHCTGGYETEATFDMAAGTTYWILVGSFWCGDQPPTTINITFNCSKGACCLGETCLLETVTSCAALGGFYLGDDSICEPDTCLYGACCTDTGCQELTSGDCSIAGGDFLGNGTDCWPDPCPPINETCATAIPIADGMPAIEGTNALASEEDDAEASCSWSNKDLWYVYTATCTGTVTMDTEGSAQENTVLSVWDACGGTEIACDDDSGTELLSWLTFEAIAGRSYWVRLASFAWIGGDFDINVSCAEAPQGACCVAGGCMLDYRLTCEDAEGVYGGDGTACVGDDCNDNGLVDLCDVLSGASPDCNGNGVPDECDLAAGTSLDRDGNGVPDECDPDCNSNGIIDGCDVTCAGGCGEISGCGLSADCQGDGTPDECQLVDDGCEGVRYDSGLGDLVNGVRPDSGWTYVGIADDFVLDDDTEGTCFRFDMYDFVDSGNLTTLRVRIYDNPNGLLNLGSFWAATPLFDQTYSVDGGSLTITDTGEDMYGYDLLRFLASGPEYALAAGSYAVHLSFPGTDQAGFWATAGSDASDCAVYWGDWMDWPMDTCGGGDDLTRLSFALLGAASNDCNENLVPDECDIAEGTSNDCNASGEPDECEAIAAGDFDVDGDVDVDDFMGLADCLAGPGVAPAPATPACVQACLDAFDFDADEDVDLADWAAFQVGFAGAAD